MPGRGTLLNFATVLVGALVGLALQNVLSASLLEGVRTALGLVTIGIGIKLFLASRNPVIVILSLVGGVLIGSGMFLDEWIMEYAGQLQQLVGGNEQFANGLVTTSVLFCVGPMTLLGCIRDAIDRDIELLKIKSTMDGIVAVFFAAAFGAGVVATAFVVLIFQGLLTLLASPMRRIADDREMVDEISAVGGPILLGVGLSLAQIKSIASANFLPALFLAPLIVVLFRLRKTRPKTQEESTA